MNWASAAIRFLDRHPRLGAVPTPGFVERALAAHQRRERLVVQIMLVSDRRAARAALWLARGIALATLGEVPVESTLVSLRELILSGAIRRS